MTRHRTAQLDAYFVSVGLILALVVYQAGSTRKHSWQRHPAPGSGPQIILFVFDAAGLALCDRGADPQGTPLTASEPRPGWRAATDVRSGGWRRCVVASV